MSRRKSFIAVGLMTALMLSSCKITVPVAATSEPIGSKVGKSSGRCFFGICLNVDASIMTAAENGNISRISTVDFSTKNILGIVRVYECVVTGE